MPCIGLPALPTASQVWGNPRPLWCLPGGASVASCKLPRHICPTNAGTRPNGYHGAGASLPGWRHACVWRPRNARWWKEHVSCAVRHGVHAPRASRCPDGTGRRRSGPGPRMRSCGRDHLRRPYPRNSDATRHPSRGTVPMSTPLSRSSDGRICGSTGPKAHQEPRTPTQQSRYAQASWVTSFSLCTHSPRVPTHRPEGRSGR